MAKRKHYDDKFRASAIVMLEATGYPDNPFKLEEVARELKVPGRTLRRWYNGEHNPPPDDVVTELKGELVDKLEQMAHQIVGAMPNMLDDASLQQAAVTLGIVIEKWQLLKGEPTERSEVVDNLNDDERATRIATLLDAARNRRDIQAGASSPENNA